MGIIFIRNETIDFAGRTQKYFSPFEHFIRAAKSKGLPYRFILPVTNKQAEFDDPVVETSVDKVGSARGFAHGLWRSLEIVTSARKIRARSGFSTVVVRVPEHTNLLLLPLLRVFRFEIIIWLVHDRHKVTNSDREARHGLRAELASVASKITGHLERRFLKERPVVSNGRELSSRYCNGNPNVHVIYSSLLTEPERIDLKHFANAYRRVPNELRLVYAGRISVEKGIDRLLDFVEILQELAAPYGVHCTCKIIGKVDATMSEYLKSRLETAKCPRAIELCGFVRRGPILWSYLSESDFFCLLSSAEGTPRVIPEAYACGLPVVVSPDANADSIVKETDFTLSDGDLQSLGKRVLSTYMNETKYLGYRSAVLERARQLTMETVFECFESVASKADSRELS